MNGAADHAKQNLILVKKKIDWVIWVVLMNGAADHAKQNLILVKIS